MKIEDYMKTPDIAGIPTRKQRELHLGSCAMELNVSQEYLFEYITNNNTAQTHPQIYLSHLANILKDTHEELPRILDRKIRPEREMKRIKGKGIKRTLAELSQAA